MFHNKSMIMNELPNKSPLARLPETLPLLAFEWRIVVYHLSAQTAVSIEQNAVTITCHLPDCCDTRLYFISVLSDPAGEPSKLTWK